jgi:lipoprotein-anchoring transpeptidase ErfK/SrfK
MSDGMQIVISFVLAILISLVAAQYIEANAQGLSPRGMWDDYESSAQPWSFDVKPAPMIKPAPYTLEGGNRPVIIPEEPEIVEFFSSEEPGTIVIDTAGKRLYYVIDSEEALEYPISVGREGFTWTGVEKISRIQEWPDWNPPKEMLERKPEYPVHMAGGINNPLGAVAMYLGNTLYRIHGTNDPKSIGQAASSGCIRMLNEHAVHLASLVQVGTTVKVVESLSYTQ